MSATAIAPAPTGHTSVTVHPPHNLDLSSTTASIAVASGHTSTLLVGATTRVITSTSLLTPAEVVALYQVLRTGHQSLLLGSGGDAVGGTFNLTPRLSGRIADLVIPKGVTAISNFASGRSVTISGTLTNNGTIYALSSNPTVTAAVFSALNIVNQQGGLITSILPSSAIPGYANATPRLTLTLSAGNNLLNAGTIASSGNLSVSAGGSIVNALPPGATGTSPTMSAANSISISGSQIVNAGLVAAQTGNISISNLDSRAIAVNNSGGILQASQGSINIRDQLFSGNSGFDLNGGSLISKEFNVFTGDGVATINADTISGVVNIHAGEAHTVVGSGDLNLGTLCLSGDPTFYSMNGNVLISGDLTFSGQDLAIVANGDIISTRAGISIDTSGTGRGGAITLIAGAAFSSSGASSALPPASGNSTSTLTITGGSTTGGKIDLASNPIAKFSSSSTAGNGGDVTLVAFGRTAAGAGTVALPTNIDITTSGANGQKNGSVTVIAGGASSGSIPTSITIGGIDTAGPGIGGAIGIHAAVPVVTTPISVTDGTLHGKFQIGAPIGGDIYLGSNTNYITTNSSVSLSGGRDIRTNGAISALGHVTATAGGELDLTATGTTKLTAVSTNSSVEIDTTGALIFVGKSMAATTFTATASGLVTFGAANRQGSVSAGRIIYLNSDDGIAQHSAQSVNAISAPLIYLTAGADGLGSAPHPLDASSLVSHQAPTIFLSSGGGIFLNGTVPAGATVASPYGINVGAVDAPGIYIGSGSAVGPVSINVDGFLNTQFPLRSPEISLKATWGITATVGNLESANTPFSLTVQGASVFLYTLGPVNFAGSSCGGCSPAIAPTLPQQFLVLADSTITFLPAATITNASNFGNVSIETRPDSNNTNSSNGSIIQTTSGTSIISPYVFLTVDSTAGSEASVGTYQVPLEVKCNLIYVTSSVPTFLAVDSLDSSPVSVQVSPPPAPPQPTPPVTVQVVPPVVAHTDTLIKPPFQSLSEPDSSASANQNPNTSSASSNQNVNTITLASMNAGLTAESARQYGDKEPNAETDGYRTPVDQDDTAQSDTQSIAVFDGDTLRLEVSSPAGMDPTNELTDCVPISYLAPKLAFATPNGYAGELRFSNETISNLQAHGLNIYTGTAKQEFTLSLGQVFFAPHRDLTVKNKFGCIRIRAGAAVLVAGMTRGLAVYNLHDSHEGDVIVSTTKHAFSLAPGNHIMIADGAVATYDELNPLRKIAHRGQKVMQLEDGTKCLSSEFSIVSALVGLKEFRQMRHSSNAADLRVVDRMMKTAAIVMQLKARNGPYNSPRKS